MEAEAMSVTVDNLSDSSEQDLRPFIGRTVAAIASREYTLEITFTDGSTLTATGNRWDGCRLRVDTEEPKP